MSIKGRGCCENTSEGYYIRKECEELLTNEERGKGHAECIPYLTAYNIAHIYVAIRQGTRCDKQVSPRIMDRTMGRILENIFIYK